MKYSDAVRSVSSKVLVLDRVYAGLDQQAAVITECAERSGRAELAACFVLSAASLPLKARQSRM